MSNLLRLLMGAAVVCAASNTHAIPTPNEYLCGTGTISEVIEGGWGWEGMLLSMDWENGGPSGQLPLNRSGTVRVHSNDVSDHQMKVLRSAAWLAFANGFRVKLVTGAKTPDGSVDCGSIREIHLMK